MKSKLSILFLFISILYFSGCSGGNAYLLNLPEHQKSNIDNSLIIYIHGDGSYLYHDENGNEIISNERILVKSKIAANQLNKSEVFIFHHKPASSFLFFPLDDKEFYYYKNGKLLVETEYKYQPDLENFLQEAEYYRKISPAIKNDSIKQIFLFYGHEIPVDNNIGYHASHSEKEFNINTFSQGIQYFTQNKFDLVVLSTCKNGSIEVVKEFDPVTNYLIASPEDLHLSQMNPEYLTSLNRTNSTYDFALNFAEQSFNELKETTLTINTISVYEVDKVINSLKKIDRNDPENINGIKVFYNPPEFGEKKNEVTHPGIKISN